MMHRDAELLYQPRGGDAVQLERQRDYRGALALALALLLGVGVATAYVLVGPRALIGLVGLVIWPGYLLLRRMSMIAIPGGLEISFNEAIQEISAAAPERIQEVAAAQIRLLSDYYQTVLAQARQSFRWALLGVAIGLAFFVAAIIVQLAEQATDAATISAISGGLVQVVAGINFVLYGRTTVQLAQFHERLERTQRFLLANSICESIGEEARDNARLQLVAQIAGFESALRDTYVGERDGD